MSTNATTPAGAPWAHSPTPIFEVHPLDENFAVVIGRYRLERSKKDGGNVEGLFSLVVEKTDNGWKIVVDHTT